MLPYFEGSCNTSKQCESDGWSILVLYGLAKTGKKDIAWDGIKALKDSVFEAAAGNGHSKTNTFWTFVTL